MLQENLVFVACAVGGLMFGIGVVLGLIAAPRPPPTSILYPPPPRPGGGCGIVLLALVGLGVLFLLWQSSVVAGLNP